MCALSLPTVLEYTNVQQLKHIKYIYKIKPVDVTYFTRKSVHVFIFLMCDKAVRYLKRGVTDFSIY